MSITIATDGACSGSPGLGGWAWVSEGGFVDSGYALATTNNRMELTAVLRALEAWSAYDKLIVTDSKYVIGCLTEWYHRWRERGWRNAKGKPVGNQDLIAACLEWTVNVEFQHVRGHSGHTLNELADYYAVMAKDRG